MRCARCGQALEFLAKARDGARARRFSTFGAVLLVPAAVAHAWDATPWAWAWAWAGMAGYVLSQALFKWYLSRWATCGCPRGRTVLRTRDDA